MVKFKLPADRIHVQRAILLSIIGMISFGIVKDHQNYEREVTAYMNSLEYRRAREEALEYGVQRMKQNQRRLAESREASSRDARVEGKNDRSGGRIW